MKANLAVSAVLGWITVVLGAFASHALQDKLSAEALDSFETAILYQMFHVLAVLFVNTFDSLSEKSRNMVSRLFFAGILFFSGSIYAIYLLEVPASSIWFITPLGGLLLICGWLSLFISIVKNSKKV